MAALARSAAAAASNGAGETTSLDDLTKLLDTFTASITSAKEALPSLESIVPPEHGISLLNVKNEAFLEYLWNVVFLMIVKLRNLGVEESERKEQEYQEAAIKKLVELRVYLDRGVRPLEGRLKFQVDKAVRAANERDRLSQAKKQNGAQKSKSKPKAATSDDEEAASDNNADTASNAEDEDEADNVPSDPEESSYAPNTAAFIRPSSGPRPTLKATKDAARSADDDKPGIYKPPRINPTALPDQATKASRRPTKSHAVDDFIASEFSSAPMAEPSIGSTIVSGGRHMTSQRERAEQAQRRAYEESNFVRLPGKSKKEMAKQRGNQRMGYGGEEWKGLGDGLDRINELTRAKGGKGALEKSRKRGREVQDGTRGTGVVGEMFERKKRRHSKK